MAQTPRLNLPLLAEAQDSPEVPVNQIVYELDAILQGGVIQRDLTTPPGGPAEGDAYIVPDNPTGAWVGHTDDIAAFQGGGWKFYTPRNGWTMHVQTEGIRVRFGIGSPSTWTPDTGSGVAIGVPGSPSQLIQDVSRLNFTDGTIIDNGDGSVDIATGGGGGGSITVIGLDTPITVSAVDTIQFASATVEDEGGGVVTVTPSGGGGGSGLENLTPDTHPYNPSANDDEFEGGSLDLGLWTWRNQGSATATESQGAVVLTTGSSTLDLRIIEQPTSGSTWKYRCKVMEVISGTGNFAFGGMTLANSANGKTISWMLQRGGGTVLQENRWTNATTFSASVSGINPWGDNDKRNFYLEIESDGTNIILRYSFTGVDGTFVQYNTETIASFLGTADRIGLFISTSNGSNASLVVDWFRKVA